jgi:DNA-binding CsgD family transcriptional regulator
VIGPDQVEWLDLLEEEHDNFRAALAWARNGSVQLFASGTGDSDVPQPVEIGLRLAVALERYWLVRNYFSEGREQLRSMLELESRRPGSSSRQALRVRALLGKAALATRQDHVTLAGDLSREALAISRSLNDKQSVACSLLTLAQCGAITDIAARIPLLEESRALFEEIGDTWNLGRTVFQLGNIATWQGNPSGAIELFLRSLELLEQAGDLASMAHTLLSLGFAYAYVEDFDKATACIKRSLNLNERLRNNWGNAVALWSLVGVEAQYRNPTDLRPLSEEAAAIFRDLGAMEMVAQCLSDMARMSLAEGNLSEAGRLLDESLHIIRFDSPDAQEPLLDTAILYFQGVLAQKRGAPHEAARLFRDCLTAAAEIPQRFLPGATAQRVACTLAALAALEPEPSARVAALAGSAEALMSTSDVPMPYDERILYEQNLAAVRARLRDSAKWQLAWEAAQTLDIDTAIAFALQETAHLEYAEGAAVAAAVGAGPRLRRNYPHNLSRREVEVLRLLAQGLTNEQIAKRLFLSTNTVRAHVYSVYSKIDVKSRVAAARFAQEHELA